MRLPLRQSTLADVPSLVPAEAGTIDRWMEWSGLLFPALALRDFLAFLARLGETDRDRLFPAGHFLSAAAALERPALALVHRAFDFLGGAFRIFAGHNGSSGN